ncbi:MAG: hypothetical protein ACO3XZ_08205 [Ilumatobacteraceae bacterium]
MNLERNKVRKARASQLLLAALTASLVLTISPTVASAKQTDRNAAFRLTSGFNPKRDGFSFANWVATPVEGTGVALMVQIFGRNSICKNAGSVDDCVPFESAEQFANQVEERLAQGRCEGLAVFAAKIFAEKTTPGSLLPIETLSQNIDFWWATQMLPAVSAKSRSSRSLKPSQLIDEIRQGVLSGATSTLGMYFQGQGHTVLPISIEKKGGQVHVGVYDSNTPEMTQTLRINTKTQVWTYSPISSDGETIFSWSHKGSGALDVIPLSLRTPQQTDYFSRASIKE